MPARIMAFLALALLVLVGGATDAEAKGSKSKAKVKYHLELSEVTSKAEGADKALVDAVIPLLTAEVNKAFANHEQLIAQLDGAPDPAVDPKGYAKWLEKKKIAGSYKVNVEIAMYTEEIEDATSGNGDKRLVIRLELKMFGETIPERKMGFVGEGGSAIKQDVGKKVRPKDREFAMQEAVSLAVADALAESLQKLAAPPAKPAKKKSKK